MGTMTIVELIIIIAVLLVVTLVVVIIPKLMVIITSSNGTQDHNVTCHLCGGSGISNAVYKCTACEGYGKLQESKTIR